jgi:putative transposase
MAVADETVSRAAKVVAVIRALGRGPFLRAQALMTRHLLDVHWTTVYRRRRRFLADPVLTSVNDRGLR